MDFEIKGQTIEVEDYNGNTIGAMELDISYDGNISIINLIGFDIADQDEDDIFGTDGKIRLQANNKAVHLNDIADWQEEELDNMVRDTLPDDDYFEMHEPGYHVDRMFNRIVYDD